MADLRDDADLRRFLSQLAMNRRLAKTVNAAGWRTLALHRLILFKANKGIMIHLHAFVHCHVQNFRNGRE